LIIFLKSMPDVSGLPIVNFARQVSALACFHFAKLDEGNRTFYERRVPKRLLQRDSARHGSGEVTLTDNSSTTGVKAASRNELFRLSRLLT
jgi:hypothetical protein